jgi:hypothetical protein
MTRPFRIMFICSPGHSPLEFRVGSWTAPVLAICCISLGMAKFSTGSRDKAINGSGIRSAFAVGSHRYSRADSSRQYVLGSRARLYDSPGGRLWSWSLWILFAASASLGMGVLVGTAHSLLSARPYLVQMGTRPTAPPLFRPATPTKPLGFLVLSA